MDIKDLIGKTISDIRITKGDEFEPKSLMFTFTDGAKASLIGGGEDYGYDGEGEYLYEKVNLQFFEENVD